MKNPRPSKTIASTVFSSNDNTEINAAMHHLDSGWIAAVTCGADAFHFDLGATASVGRQKALLAHLLDRGGVIKEQAYSIYQWCFSVVSSELLTALREGNIEAPHYYVTADHQKDVDAVVINIRRNSSIFKAMVSSLDLLKFLKLNPDTVIYDSLAIAFVEERLLWKRAATDRINKEVSDIARIVCVKTEYWTTLLAEQNSDWWVSWESYGMHYNPTEYTQSLINASRPAYITNQPKRLFTDKLIASSTFEANRQLRGVATLLDVGIYRLKASWLVNMRIGGDSVQLEMDATLSIKSQQAFWHALCQWFVSLNFAKSPRLVAKPRADGSLSYSTLSEKSSGVMVVKIAQQVFDWTTNIIGTIVVKDLLAGDITANHTYIYVEHNIEKNTAVVGLYRNQERYQTLDSIATHHVLMRNPDLVIYPSPACDVIEKDYLLVGANAVKNHYFFRLGLTDFDTFLPIKSLYWYDSLDYQRNKKDGVTWRFCGGDFPKNIA